MVKEKTLKQRFILLGFWYFVSTVILMSIVGFSFVKIFNNFNFYYYISYSTLLFLYPVGVWLVLSIYSVFVTLKFSQLSHDIVLAKGKKYGEWIWFIGSIFNWWIPLVFIILYFFWKWNFNKKINDKIMWASWITIKILTCLFWIFVLIVAWLLISMGINNRISNWDFTASEEYLYYEGALGWPEELQSLKKGNSYCDSEECKAFFQEKITLITK